MPKSIIDTGLADGLTSAIEQVSLIHVQNHYLVMYDLGVAICSLAQYKSCRVMEQTVTVEIKKDKAEMVPQLRSGIIW